MIHNKYQSLFSGTSGYKQYNIFLQISTTTNNILIYKAQNLSLSQKAYINIE